MEPHDLLVGVAAHVSREEMAYGLVDRVEADFLNIDKGDARTRTDAITYCAANHLAVLRGLQSVARDHLWCIVLEDDAEPIADFRTHAAAALGYAQSPIVGFYINRAGTAHNLKMLQQARATGAAWMVTNHLVSALAYAINVNALDEIICRYVKCGYDRTVEGRLTDWAGEKRRFLYGEPRFYYTMPSLVDHSVVESLIHPEIDAQIRRAWSLGFVTDWDTPAVEYDPLITT